MLVSDIQVPEGSQGTVEATFTVTLTAPSGLPVSVDYATADGTAIAPADYTAVLPSTLTFDPGLTTRTITVVVNADTLDELNETFLLDLSNVVNANLPDAQAVATITDDDAPPTLSVNDVTLAEGNEGTSNATFTVSLSAPSGQEVTVNWATANGTAVAPADYETAGGTLTFAPGETSKPVPVPVHGDTAYELNETFVVNLSSAVRATLSDAQGVGTIANDDPAPPPPPEPPPPPPPPPDTTAPAEVTNLRVTAGDEVATIAWTNPSDPDFQGVSVRRIQAGKTVQNFSVYDGGGTTFTDRGLKNGSQYRYRIKTRDRSGNESAGVVVNALPKAALFAPAEGAVVTAPPLLQWILFPGATYYNAQLYRIRGGGQAQALAATKVLSVWPTTTRYKLKKTWRFGGKRYRLVPGQYRWYVWPGLGKRSKNKYGPMLGDSTFTVKAKKRRR
jgi:hypothetical protein